MAALSLYKIRRCIESMSPLNIESMSPLKLLVLFAVTDAVFGVFGNLRRRSTTKSPLRRRIAKGKPFKLQLFSEFKRHSKKRGIFRRANPATPSPGSKTKSDWLSRIKNAIRKPTTPILKPKRRFGIFRKHIDERFDGSVNATLGSADIADLKQEDSSAELVFDQVYSHSFLRPLFKFGYEVANPIIKLNIAGKTHHLLFDTGSTKTFIPQAGAELHQTGPTFGRTEPLYRPVADEDPSILPNSDLRYLGNLNSNDFFGFVGKIRILPLLIEGQTLQVSITTASNISNLDHSITGASPQRSPENLPYQILTLMAEPRKWFSVFVWPIGYAEPDAPIGDVVFGDINRHACWPQIFWMGDRTSGANTPASIHPFWTIVLDSIWLNGQSLFEPEFPDQPIVGTTDTGSPGIFLNSAIFNELIRRLGIAPNQRGYHHAPCYMQFILTLRARNHDGTAFHDIPLSSGHLLRKTGVPNDCLLMILNGGPNSAVAIGFPLFQSACVVHDFERQRLGFARPRH